MLARMLLYVLVMREFTLGHTQARLSNPPPPTKFVTYFVAALLEGVTKTDRMESAGCISRHFLLVVEQVRWPVDGQVIHGHSGS